MAFPSLKKRWDEVDHWKKDTARLCRCRYRAAGLPCGGGSGAGGVIPSTALPNMRLEKKIGKVGGEKENHISQSIIS